MQGTAGLGDFLSDGDLSLFGAARDQIADMVNWWLRITTASGEPTPQIENLSSPMVDANGQYEYFKFIAPVAGTGELAGVTDIQVNGHSLGGHLATAFARIFGGSTTIDHVTTFNSAGFTLGSEAVFQSLQKMLGMGTDTSPGAGQQSNFFAKNGINVTTNTFWFNQVGQRVDVFNEEGAGFPNHYMYKLTDALALGDVLARLDPTLDFTRLNALLEAGSNMTEASLEGILDGLRKTLTEVPIAETPIGDASGSAVSRTAFHERLHELQDNAYFQMLEGRVRIVATPVNGLAAKEDFGTLLSLNYLTPFALQGESLNEVWQLAQPGLYAKWQADQNLPANDDEGVRNFSEQWLEDRVHMLQELTIRNKTNQTGILVDQSLRYSTSYVDGTTGLQVLIDNTSNTPLPSMRRNVIFGGEGNETITGNGNNDHLYGGGGDDDLDGESGDDYLEGNAGNDKLAGGAGNDMLLGGDGDDTLTGGTDRDVLKGGAGNDTYAFSAGDGGDTIIDADGLGEIKIDGQQITGGKKVAGGYWISDDRQYRFSLITGSSGGTDLVIRKGSSADTITIHNWQAGQLGIQMQDADPLPDAPADRVLVLTPTAGEGVHFSVDSSDTGAYSITGTPFSDVVAGGSGDDQIAGNGGFDRLDGGAGNDRLYDGAVIGVDAAIDAARITRTLTTASIFEGGTGDDLLVGGTTNYMYAGGGSDTLIGGGSNDVLQGDTFDGGYGTALDTLSQHFEYDETRHKYHYYVTRTNNGITSYYSGLGHLAEDGAADILVAGGGDDVAFGELGDDYLSLGAGNDRGVGGEGADAIHGDDGNDLLFGDFGWDASTPDANATQQELVNYAGLPAQYHGNDVLDGGAGDDYLEGNGFDDHLYGGAGADRLLGDDKITPGAFHGNDYLDGGSGNDTLEGGGRDDELFGGAGDDKLFGDDAPAILAGTYHGRDYLDGEDGNDYLQGDGNDDTLFGGDGNDVLWGDATTAGLADEDNGSDDLDGEDGDDQMVGGGKGDQLFGGRGNDILRGDGDVALVAGVAQGADYLDGGQGEDFLAGDGGNDTLFGGDGNDELQGDYAELAGQFHGDDYLDGGSGDDILLGGGGNDTLFGGEGDDMLHGDSDGLAVQFHGNDTLDGGAGNDTMAGGGGNDQLFGGTGDDLMAGGEGDDQLSGGEGMDQLQGGAGNDTLDGGAGSDLMLGGEGNDVLIGDGGGVRDADGFYSGGDWLEGGAGDDTYYAGAGDTIVDEQGLNTLMLGQGVSAGSVTMSLAKDDDSLLVVQVGGDQPIFIENGLTSAAIATYRFEDGTSVDQSALVGDTLLESVNLVATRGIAYGGARDDRLTAVAGVAAMLSGGRGDDLLQGSDGDDTLTGGLGNDTLSGGDGNDLLEGGAGNDFLFGGAGDDTLYGGADGAYLDGGDGNDALYAGSGGVADDPVYAYGGEGDDTLVAGTGSAVLDGGSGHNVYVLNADSGSTVIGQGAGSGSLKFGAGIGLADLTLSAAASGNDRADLLIQIENGASAVIKDGLQGRIDEVTFDDGSTMSMNQLLAQAKIVHVDIETDTGSIVLGSGNDNDHSVIGGAGDDTVYGAGSDDVLIGGAGDDTFVVSAQGQSVLEQFDEGRDTIVTSVSYSLPQNVENMTLTGSEDLTAYGNNLDNVLIGNGGNSTLVAGYGNDTLIAGAGSTTMIGGNGNVTFVVHGTDDTIIVPSYTASSTVQSSVNYTLTAGVQNLTLTGDADLTGRGNNLDNVIVANSGNDTLYGGAGADVLIGGPGHTTYVLSPDWEIDTVFGVAGAENTIALDASVRIDQLHASRSDDDLLLTVDGGEGGFRIRNYYQDEASWDLAASDTQPIPLADLLAQLTPAPSPSDSRVDAYRNAFLENLKSQIGDGWIVSSTDRNGNLQEETVRVSTIETASDAPTLSAVQGGTSDWAVEFLGNKTRTFTRIATVIDPISHFVPIDAKNAQEIVGIFLPDGAVPVYGGSENKAVGYLSISGYGSHEEVTSYTVSVPTYKYTSVGDVYVEIMQGGAADQTIDASHRYKVVDAGSGDDVVFDFYVDGVGTFDDEAGTFDFTDEDVAAFRPEHEPGYDYEYWDYDSHPDLDPLSDFLYGNDGNDVLLGSLGRDELIGGTGDDILNGGGGADVYRVLKGDDQGRDLIMDSATPFMSGPRFGDGILSDEGRAVLDAMRRADDHEDFLLNRNFIRDIKWLSDHEEYLMPWSLSELPPYLQALYGTDDIQQISVADALAFPLATEYEKLQPLYDAGLIAKDTIAFGEGITRADLRVSMGSTSFGSPRATLDISWGDAAGIAMVLPDQDDPVGYGIEQFAFSDGSTMSMSEMLSLAAPAGFFIFMPGMGAAVLTGDNDQIRFADEIGPEEVNVKRDGADLLLSYLGGEDVLRLPDWYANGTTAPDLLMTFADGTTWGTSDLLAKASIPTDGADLLYGTGGNDALHGLGDNDVLLGLGGNDLLDGGEGGDQMTGGDGDDTYIVDATDDTVIESAGEGNDTVLASVSYGLSDNVENIRLTGSAYYGQGNALNNVLVGNAGNNLLLGWDGDDTLDGGTGGDAMIGGRGNDTYIVSDRGDWASELPDEGIDVIRSSVAWYLMYNTEVLILTGAATYGAGNDENNLVIGNDHAATLFDGEGDDILEGGAGADQLSDSAGNNLLNGGAGSDAILGGDGNEFFVGGVGNDFITTGEGADVLAFNRGDGKDVIYASAGKDNSVSLGGGITYADLLFSKSGEDLIFSAGADDQITFKDWYADGDRASVKTLQVILDGSSDYDPTSDSEIRNQKIEQFDFKGLVARFDTARAAEPGLTSWGLASSLMDFHLGGSDTAAIGGDFAYQYGLNGNFASMSMLPSGAILDDPAFGRTAQNLRGAAELRDWSTSLI